MAMIYPAPMTKKLKISIDTVVKWSNAFVIKIKCIEHRIWDPSMRSFFVIVQAYIPITSAVGNTVNQWKFWYCLSVKIRWSLI